MGNAADGGEAKTLSNDPVDVAQRSRDLHAHISKLLSNDALLAKECDELMPEQENQVPEQVRGQLQEFSGSEEEGEYEENDDYEAEIATEQSQHPKLLGREHQISPQDLRKATKEHRISPQELRQVTQSLIDRLGCRQPDVLHRVTAVYAGFAGRREGLTVLEFRGYVACVLTQLQRELEHRCAAAGVRIAATSEVPQQLHTPDNCQNQRSIAEVQQQRAFQESTDQAECSMTQFQRSEAAALYSSYEPPLHMEHDPIQYSVPSNICTAHLPSNEKVELPKADPCIDGVQQPQQDNLKLGEEAEEEEVSELQMLTRSLDALNKSLFSASEDKESIAVKALGDPLNIDKPCIDFDRLPDLVAATLSNRDIHTDEIGETSAHVHTKPNGATNSTQSLVHALTKQLETPVQASASELHPQVGMHGPQPQPNLELSSQYGPRMQPDVAIASSQRFTNGHEQVVSVTHGSDWSGCNVKHSPMQGYLGVVDELSTQPQSELNLYGPQQQPGSEQYFQHGQMMQPDVAAASSQKFVNGHGQVVYNRNQQPLKGYPGVVDECSMPPDSLPTNFGPNRNQMPLQGYPGVVDECSMPPDSLPTNFGPNRNQMPLQGYPGVVGECSMSPDLLPTNFGQGNSRNDMNGHPCAFEPPRSSFCGMSGANAGFSPPPPSPPQSPREKAGIDIPRDRRDIGQEGVKMPLTAKDLGVVGYGTAPENVGCEKPQANQEADADGSSLVKGVYSRVKATGSNLATGWQKFADTMDSIFVPEGEDAEKDTPDVDDTECEQINDAPQIETLPLQDCAFPNSQYSSSMHPQIPMGGMVPHGAAHHMSAEAPGSVMHPASGHFAPHMGVPPFAYAPQQAPEDVPLLFRTPSHEEVRDLLELEGMPAYIKLDAGRGFVEKRLCLDNGGETLYVLEADSPVPTFFFGITGFGLEGLRRIRHSIILSPEQKPLVALEFDEGYLMMKLGDPKVFQGFLGVVTSCRDTVDVIAQSDWTVQA